LVAFGQQRTSGGSEARMARSLMTEAVIFQHPMLQ
jgi:hypothetical protein